MRRRTRDRLGLAGGLAAVAVLLSACGLTHMQDLSFRLDDRLHIESPKQLAKAHQPLTIAWRMTGFRIAPVGTGPPARNVGYFAIFVDRTPIKPGQSMRAAADGDQYCLQDPRCPDVNYLTQHRIFTTTRTTFTFPEIPDRTDQTGSVQTHTFTIVLMDTSGHRIGESAWQLDVRIPKVST